MHSSPTAPSFSTHISFLPPQLVLLHPGDGLSVGVDLGSPHRLGGALPLPPRVRGPVLSGLLLWAHPGQWHPLPRRMPAVRMQRTRPDVPPRHHGVQRQSEHHPSISASLQLILLPFQSCLHNTAGQSCERCRPGFDGDALLGTPEDCRPCRCPLDVPSNNFSPTCERASAAGGGFDKFALAPDDYVCTDCPRGYAGPHCERYSSSRYTCLS